MIGREKPGSVTELAELSGRSKSNLSRTLKTMSRYGLVELQEGERGTLVPRVPYDQVRLDVSLDAAAAADRGSPPEANRNGGHLGTVRASRPS